MKRIILVFMTIVALIGCARQPWTKTDKALFGAAVVANGYDFYTTKRILDDGGYIKDPWPFLYGGDERPNTGKLAVSKAAQLGIAWVVLDRVPSKWRKPVLILMTGTWVYYGVTN